MTELVRVCFCPASAARARGIVAGREKLSKFCLQMRKRLCSLFAVERATAERKNGIRQNQKFMKIEWTTQSGLTAKVEINVDFELMRNGNHFTDGAKEVFITASVGASHCGFGAPAYGTKGLPAGFPANIGKLAIPAAILPEIESTVAAATAEVADHNAPYIEAAKMANKAHLSMRAMEKKMAYGEI